MTEAGSPGGATPPPYTPPPYTAGPAAAPFEPGNVTVQTGKWISDGWNLVTGDWVTFGLAALVMLVISSVVPFILQGALITGLHIMVKRKMLVGQTEIGDLFKGFNYFVPALIVNLLVTVFAMIGMLACIIPAFVVGAMYMFPYLFVVDRKMEFWPAMQASHAIVKKDYLGFTLFFLALVGLQILGALACIVGILITLPMMFAAITAAYRDIAGFQSGPDA
ncbi:MAG: hypothetical protein R2729_29975 [Bryobacteraceae bacterium]